MILTVWSTLIVVGQGFLNPNKQNNLWVDEVNTFKSLGVTFSYKISLSILI